MLLGLWREGRLGPYGPDRVQHVVGGLSEWAATVDDLMPRY